MGDGKPDRDELMQALLEVGSGRVRLADVLGMHDKPLSALVDRALGKINMGKVEDGEAELLKLSMLDSTSPVLPLLIGGSKLKRGDAAGARAAYDEAVARAIRAGVPAYAARVRFLRAQAHLQEGHAFLAEADLRAAAEGADAEVAAQAQKALDALTAKPG